MGQWGKFAADLKFAQKKLYCKEKWVKQAKNSAASTIFFTIVYQFTTVHDSFKSFNSGSITFLGITLVPN